QGTGYRVTVEAGVLKLMVGFSHPVEVQPARGIQFQVEENRLIKGSGCNKQLVGQTAADIRKIKKPEPYKGKGISYQGEKIRRKAGKAAKVGAGAAA
ncbi:50S ribosomal protein L6, partial [Candidatus Beckwithbacteria bacterium RBG_13_35_6]